MFLLFVLAASWSKTGQWENAAYFITYLKITNKGSIDYWLNEENLQKEIRCRKYNAQKTSETCKGIIPRKKISFRKDYYLSIKILALNWENLSTSLEESYRKNDFYIFISEISNIRGLASNNNKMRIKIPLILRELKCQKVYNNIPGEFCCVPDERVFRACREMGIKISRVSNLISLFNASKIIYEHFGELYDIPLFAFQDLKEELTVF